MHSMMHREVFQPHFLLYFLFFHAYVFALHSFLIVFLSVHFCLGKRMEGAGWKG